MENSEVAKKVAEEETKQIIADIQEKEDEIKVFQKNKKGNKEAEH